MRRLDAKEMDNYANVGKNVAWTIGGIVFLIKVVVPLAEALVDTI